MATSYAVDYNLQKMKPFQISIWNGLVMGGGVGISQYAPIRIATDNTVWAMPETKIGFFADRGASYFLTKGKNNEGLGIYLALTGQTIKGKNLVWCGIATHFVP